MSDPSTGAQKVLQCMEREGVKHIFGYPGGAIMPIFDALYDSQISFILTRHEQGATHMADGYARATGKVGVAMATSGPGATNCVTGLMTAMMDSVPLVVLTGQVSTPLLGKDAFQEADVTGITYAVCKHSYLIKRSADLPRVIKEAFHIAQTGRPGPVLIDLPKDIALAPCDTPFADTIGLPGYHLPTCPATDLLAAAAASLSRARRPVLYVGHGAVIANAGSAIIALAEKLSAPIVTTLLGKGSCSEDHRLHLGMLGMHGTVPANLTVAHCDCIMAIGARWDDRITGKLAAFCPDACKIHLDIDVAEFGKIIRPDHCLAGDARLTVEALLPMVTATDTSAWWREIDGWRKAHPLRTGKHGGLRTSLVLERLNSLIRGEAIVVTDVGQHQMWAAQFIHTTHNRYWISSGGGGTMGFGLPAAIGAQFGRPDIPVWAIVGDGGFQMTMPELATAALHRLPIKILISHNRYLGMVRQWQELFFDNRLSGVRLDGNPDFIKLASAYGMPAWRIKRPADVDRILARAADYRDGPCLIVADVIQEDNVFPMVPPGAPLTDIITERHHRRPTKPAGSA
jgi:acetolactate synthase-1/2/3 large subunit